MTDSLRTIAVVGTGTMGLGIAQICATAGFKTLLFDSKPGQVSAALHTIERQLSQLVEKNKLTDEQKTEILSCIRGLDQLSEVKADIVIEAAVEKLDVKQQLFVALEEINGADTILSTNTSSLSVTEIAAVLRDPTRFIGLHFFNPADRMKLVEIISGTATDPRCVKAIQEFSVRIGKTAVLAKDSPGFIVNRVARHFYVESLKLLEESTADVATIDALLRSAGFRMGPFELMDLIGVDTNLAVTTSVYEGFKNAAKFKPSPIQQGLVASGHFGRKTGAGFYDYSKQKE